MQRGVHVEFVLAASIGQSCILVKPCRFSRVVQSRKKHLGLPFVRVTVTVCGAAASTGGAGVLDAEDGGIPDPGGDPGGAAGTGHQGGLSNAFWSVVVSSGQNCSVQPCCSLPADRGKMLTAPPAPLQHTCVCERMYACMYVRTYCVCLCVCVCVCLCV